MSKKIFQLIFEHKNRNTHQIYNIFQTQMNQYLSACPISGCGILLMSLFTRLEAFLQSGNSSYWPNVRSILWLRDHFFPAHNLWPKHMKVCFLITFLLHNLIKGREEVTCSSPLEVKWTVLNVVNVVADVYMNWLLLKHSVYLTLLNECIINHWLIWVH